MAGTVQRSRLQISKTTPAQRLGLLRYPLLGAKRTSLKCPRMSASAQSGHTLNQIKRWSAFFDLNQIQRPYTANSVSGILCGEGARRIIMRDNSKLLLGFFVTISFISFVFAFWAKVRARCWRTVASRRSLFLIRRRMRLLRNQARWQELKK